MLEVSLAIPTGQVNLIRGAGLSSASVGLQAMRGYIGAATWLAGKESTFPAQDEVSGERDRRIDAMPINALAAI